MLAKKFGMKIEKKFKGTDLVGLEYSSPFDDLPRVKKSLKGYAHRVIETNERILKITTEEGTGLVHIATGAGSEDFSLGKKEELPIIEIIDEAANYLDELGEFSGQNAKNHPEIIIKHVKITGHLFKKETYSHRYPACWRCKTELVWRVVDEWYIAIDPVRADMKSITKKINWIPKFGLKRELDWLDNMHDWLISKKRYWGLALPIWECSECKEFEVIGSNEELKKRAIKGWDKFDGHTPHRPWVDEVKIKCSNCGGESTRILDVGNPWLDAGIVPYSTISNDNKGTPLYLSDKDEWRKWFPADFITESFPGQFKNWFYSMIAESSVLENERPYKTVLGFATLFGEDGRPMHKSWGNSIDFNEGAEKMGVDVMRWMYVKQDPTQNLLFGYKLADQTRRSFHLMLWNVYNFFVTYANVDGWRYKADQKFEPEDALDVWIITLLHETLIKVTKSLDKYDSKSAAETIENFVHDVSLWYVRRSRDRVGPTANDDKSKENYYTTMIIVLSTLSKMLMPFTPFIAEEIYGNLTGKSVQLADWPVTVQSGVLKDKKDGKTLENMAYVREIAERGHSARKEANLAVRQPLNKITVFDNKDELHKEYLQLLKDELNVKEVKWSTKKSQTKLKVELDKKITPKLKEEGKARELLRNIQKERRNIGVELTQTVNVTST